MRKGLRLFDRFHKQAEPGLRIAAKRVELLPKRIPRRHVAPAESDGIVSAARDTMRLHDFRRCFDKTAELTRQFRRDPAEVYIRPSLKTRAKPGSRDDSAITDDEAVLLKSSNAREAGARGNPHTLGEILVLEASVADQKGEDQMVQFIKANGLPDHDAPHKQMWDQNFAWKMGRGSRLANDNVLEAA